MNERPWHLWIVGIIAVVWNGFGAFDYIMTQTENADYLANFTPAQIEYYTSLPVYLDAIWALAIWSGVLASVLLLFRSQWTTTVFVFSFIAMIASFSATYLMTEPPPAEPGQWMFTGAIIAAGVFFILYSYGTTKSRVIA